MNEHANRASPPPLAHAADVRARARARATTRAPLSQTGKAQDDPGLGGRGARGSSELSDGPKFANAYGWWQSLWAEASAHARARGTARAPHRARARV